MAGLDDSFLSELECPVCLHIPREGPIPACPVGHILCKRCREGVTICPTCRRPMLKDGTNTLANKMIEKIPHPCKYSQFGCTVKRPLNDLLEHEVKCRERTITCPDLWCQEEGIQIRKYEEHAKNSKCNRSHSSAIKFDRQNIFSYSGKTTSDLFWSVKPYEDHGKIFYFHHYYFSSDRTFAFYVTVAKNSNEAEKFLAKITLKNQNDERKCLTNIQDVISMDSAPTDKNEVIKAKSVMLVPLSMIRKFLKWTNKEEKQEAEIHTTIDILV